MKSCDDEKIAALHYLLTKKELKENQDSVSTAPGANVRKKA